MSKIYKDVSSLVGNTPIVELSKYNMKNNLNARLLGKLEYYNPSGSVKDRIAKNMIEEAEKRGDLKEGYVIIEPTSGNTGIGIAAIGASKGYKVILTMPETMSIERRKIVRALGAEIVLTDGKKGMKGAIEKAKELCEKDKNTFMPSQFENPDNPAVHFNTTGKEIYNDTDGNIDILVSGIGTGGTISGCGKYLRSKNEKIQIIAVEPADSPVLSEGKAGPHKIQGIGAGFVPDTLNTKIYDEIITVSTEDSYLAAREIAKEEGLLLGISSGAAIHAAKLVAKREENKGKNIVVILPDGGERYLSTELYVME